MSTNSPRPRAPFVVTVGAAALVGACSATSTSNNATTDGGNAAGCPANLGSKTSTCSLASDASCRYVTTCNPSFEITLTCVNGQWNVSPNNPPAPQCPATKPSPGTACVEFCGSPTPYCSYANGLCHGQASEQRATCVAGAWQIADAVSCSPSDTDSGIITDGGVATDASSE